MKWTLALLALVACTPATVNNVQTTSDAEAPAASLASPDPAVRATAAAALKKMPRVPSPEGVWKAKLAALPPAITEERFISELGAVAEMGAGGMGGSSVTVRLDDDWVVTAQVDPKHVVVKVEPPIHSLRAVSVAPPASYTGAWVTYYVDGTVNRRTLFQDGQIQHFQTYYDNGQLTSETDYRDGAPDGAELGFYRDGKKMYEIHYAAGKRASAWTHWYPNGSKQSESSYVDDRLEGPSIHYREDGTKSSRIDYHAGEETGQAAWDEHGRLAYARGTAH